ncbi:hypothetical protein [Sphingobium sp. WCS2017Hpa-17]|uniref:hypothetical protein n=1 Tax=Sphingobium sp. WCS2017Hpa-17 TaxID=3073638 RepID=UPI0028891CF0|nr:hypothetical protein [Sphingobium sp. WCS2017Hpa-17]
MKVSDEARKAAELREKYARRARNHRLSRNERTRCSHYLQVLDELSDAIRGLADDGDGG